MHLPAGALLKNGEYKIEKVLGQGGFGITYLAEQTSLGRKVALKEFFMEGLCNRDAATSHVSVPSVGSKKLVERFKQKFIKEARMIASFDNNHIISIYDVFEENGTAYYVMEYLGGKSLSAIVNEQGIMSETLAMKYIRQVADALAEVHANNLLHLDVKPANIMLNKKGEAVLIDFGISKHYDEAGNQTSSALIGTSEGYAPIEQYEAGALDSFTPATDIYALGATLFFLLTGTRPPKAGDVMNDGLPELPSEISQTASCAITAAMQPAIAKRPQSIAEFLCLVESGKMQDESDGETVLNGNVKAASKREGENLFTHTASESSFDEVKGENGKLVADEFHSIDVVEVPDSEDGNVILNESEKSQKNKPGKSLWLILLLLLIAVAGACFLFGGTVSGDAPKRDTKKPIEKKDTPIPPKGNHKSENKLTATKIEDLNSEVNKIDNSRLIELNSQFELTKFVKKIVVENAGNKNILPANTGVEIPGIEELIANYNQEIIKRDRYIENSSETNPIVADCNDKLNAMYKSINDAVDSHLENIRRSIALEEQKGTSKKVEFSKNTEQIKDAQTTDTLNGHDWVDLGLPSGLKWATCNVGASSPSDYGDYYAWGEISTKSSYDVNNSTTCDKKIGDIAGNPTYDVARAEWRGSWRLPTDKECQELLDNCTWEWTIQDGHKGYKVTSKKNGNSLFLPAAGWRYGTSSGSQGLGGYYWSATPDESYTSHARALGFNKDYCSEEWGGRNDGRSVRPVFQNN